MDVKVFSLGLRITAAAVAASVLALSTLASNHSVASPASTSRGASNVARVVEARVSSALTPCVAEATQTLKSKWTCVDDVLTYEAEVPDPVGSWHDHKGVDGQTHWGCARRCRDHLGGV